MKRMEGGLLLRDGDWRERGNEEWKGERKVRVRRRKGGKGPAPLMKNRSRTPVVVRDCSSCRS